LVAQLGDTGFVGFSFPKFLYIDSNGDLWRASAGFDEAGVLTDKLSFDSTIGNANLGVPIAITAYTSPDCSGSPSFVGVPYAHVVFFEQHLDGSRIPRVRNTKAQPTNVQIQSSLDPGTNSTGGHDCIAGPFPFPNAQVLTAADTTIVTQPGIAFSPPLHPVFTP
jgi:hypothetical protein